MSTTSWQAKVVPARLSFLAIYNPSLGPTDDTFRDQLVFYYSRAAQETKAAARKSGRNEAASSDTLREEENEKLRQIGLAQGMVEFARSFSDGAPVDAIDTEKSRIVLHELDKGWWILASVDLTRLPSLAHAAPEPVKKSAPKTDAKPRVEYSSREISTPALLLQHLLQAYHIFCLHHGPSLDDLYVRLSRDGFCSLLSRFWTRFSRTWDVLLHGNPAADVFTGLKLASGGELGFGVGEEEWGSGEREVLEDLVHRTEGLVDLMVSRFGQPAHALETEKAAASGYEALPWLGGGNQPGASDGVVFSGVGAIPRPSMRNVSLWIRQIYTYGDHAYGVRDNPIREPRKRRRRNLPAPMEQANGSALASMTSHEVDAGDLRQKVLQTEAVKQNESSEGPIDPALLPGDLRPRTHNRTTSSDRAREATEASPPPADHPSIPPPIVSAAEQALNKATNRVDQDATNVKDEDKQADAGTMMGIPDQYMKYLTFGLSELGKPKRPAAPQQTSTSSSKTVKPVKSREIAKPVKQQEQVKESDDDTAPTLAHLDPLPDGESLKAKIALQRRLEDQGYFVIGLKGDLDDLPDDEAADISESSEANGTRTVLRTLHAELPSKEEADVGNENTKPTPLRTPRDASLGSTSEAAKNFRRLRVVVYVRQPFMYCFLFEKQTSSLQYSSFYKELHRNLQPIHKPLLSSTSVAKIKQLIEASHATPEEDARSIRSSTSNRLPSRGTAHESPIYDLLFDPRTLTLHTSIPNIPEPGTPAAEGLATGDTRSNVNGWSRVDAMHVHSQILNTLVSVKGKRSEIERTSKTTRGWWVVWLKILPSAPTVAAQTDDGTTAQDGSTAATQDENTTLNLSRANNAVSVAPSHHDMHRTAFLVRKSPDATPTTTISRAGSRVASGMFSSMGFTTSKEETTGGAVAGWGPLTSGIGFDARRYVEGLLSLNR